MRRLASARFSVAFAALVLLASACGSDGGASGPDGTTDPGVVADVPITPDATAEDAPAIPETTEDAPVSACVPDPCVYGECIGTDDGFQCLCETNWVGPLCDVCPEGFHDEDGCWPDGLPCADDMCSGHGQCDDSIGTAVCTCDKGWGGTWCDTCATDWHLEGSECVPDQNVCVPDPCKGHGNCTADGFEWTCACDIGFAGDDCGQCAEGYVALASGACVSTASLTGALQFSWVEGNVYDRVVFAGGVFSAPPRELEAWLYGFPPPVDEHFQQHGCVFNSKPCFVAPPAGPAFADAGKTVTVSWPGHSLALDRIQDPQTYELAYYPANAVPEADMAFGSTHHVSVEGGVSVPAFEVDFPMVSRLIVTSHDLSGNGLDLVHGRNLELRWDLPLVGTQADTLIVLNLTIAQPFLGVAEWLTLGLPDSGSATVPASLIDLLGQGDLQMYLARVRDTDVAVEGSRPVRISARSLYLTQGTLHPAGTRLVSLSPSGAAQGQTIQAKLDGIGTAFETDKTTVLTGGGFTVSNVSATGPEAATFDLSVAPYTPVGTYAVLVRTPGDPAGDLFPEDGFTVTPAKPDCTTTEDAAAATSGTLADGAVACGAIEAEGDEDVWDVPLKAGEALAVELFTEAFGSTLDPRLVLTDPAGNVLIQEEWDLPHLSTVATVDGTYRIRVADGYGQGGADRTYWLKVAVASPIVLEPSDSCAKADAAPVLDFGVLYSGDTTASANTIYPELADSDYPACLYADAFGGNDEVRRVAVAPGETIVAWALLHEADAAVYLLAECGKVATCMAAADRVPWRRPDALVYRNDTAAAQTLYLVVDTSWSSIMAFPKGGPFLLKVDRYPTPPL